MSVYYNEFDKLAAEALRQLMAEGLIPEGIVDERPIEKVQPGDLDGYVQCHFFTGTGAWPYTLKHLVGWPDYRPVWTGSCPCQSFSDAGAGRGFDDKRHLWPEFFRLIAARHPPLVFGEQVAAAVRRGRGDQSWLDLVSSDLGSAGYEVGAAVFPAAYVGAPHRRDRLYFVADSSGFWRPPECQLAGTSVVSDFWSGAVWKQCGDGKRRPAPPGVGLLADGAPEAVGAMRCAGNAIVPQQAAEFIRSYLEAVQLRDRTNSGRSILTYGASQEPGKPNG